MLQNSYICPWCKKDLRGKEIPLDARREYNNCTNFTLATELYQTGFECEECSCRWRYNGELIREGIPELKDKYKIEEITEETKDKSVVTENSTTENDSENNNLNNESEGKLDE